MVKRALSVLVASLALAAPATAAPWDGGFYVVTPVEATLTNASRTLTGKTVYIACDHPDEWAASGADANTLGFVWFRFNYYLGWIPEQIAHLAPQTCTHLEQFLVASDKRAVTTSCLVGYHSWEEERPYKVRVKKRVKVGGRWVTRRVWVTRYRLVTVEEPVYDACSDYVHGKLLSIQTLAHESMHLYGFRDEAEAECFGLQFIGYTAQLLGADAALADQMRRDYYQWYLAARPGTRYYSSACAPDRELDLTPGDGIFPMKRGAPFAPPQEDRTGILVED